MNQKPYFKYTVLLPLNLILSLLSYMVPKTKNQILLGAKNCTTFLGNTKYFFLYLHQKENPFKFFWITANKKLFLELKNKNLPVVYLYSRSGFMRLLRSNFLLLTHGTLDVSYSFFLGGKFNKIQTWHGSSGIKQNRKIARHGSSTIKQDRRTSFSTSMAPSGTIRRSATLRAASPACHSAHIPDNERAISPASSPSGPRVSA